MSESMKVSVEGDELVIRIRTNQHPSKTGKSIVVATSSGNKPTECMVDGKPLTVGVNAYIAK